MKFAMWSLFVALTLAVSGTASAEVSEMSGTYQLDQEASDDLVEAFEPAVSEMSRFRRGFARRAIRRKDGPDEVMKIELNDEEIVIHAGDSPAMEIPLNGEVIEYEDSSGDIQQVSAKVHDEFVEVHTRINEGEYTAEYRIGDGGQRLEIDMVMDIDRLPKKVDYRIVYRRR